MKNTVNLEVRYHAGHTYTEHWGPLPEFHCPACGRQTIWHELSYYLEDLHLCTDCGVRFHLPGGLDTGEPGAEDQQRLDALRQHSKS